MHRTTRWYGGEPGDDTTESWVPGSVGRQKRMLDSDGILYRGRVEVPEIALRADLDVETVLAWLRTDSGDLRGDAAAVERAGSVLLTEYGVSPQFKALVFEALARIDGIEQVGADSLRDAPGAPEGGMTVLATGDGPMTQRFVLDASTGRFLGMQGTGWGPDGDGAWVTWVSTEVVDTLPPRARGAATSVDG
ncbi:MAG: hypothetical protein ACI379_08870 [Nocardioides sp.]|uniref:hypothetical protein n=1 Tax=Nocardioides sp. TaxID=35761 RepID=UPI003F0124FF